MGEWTSVNERLPEEGGWYICTCYDGVNIEVSFVKWQSRIKAWELSGRRAYWRILAWMPLPEPYDSDLK